MGVIVGLEVISSGTMLGSALRGFRCVSATATTAATATACSGAAAPCVLCNTKSDVSWGDTWWGVGRGPVDAGWAVLGGAAGRGAGARENATVKGLDSMQELRCSEWLAVRPLGQCLNQR